MTLDDPGFFITYNLIQLVALLALIRFFDLYERPPLGAVALMAFWGATGAVGVGLAGNQVVARVFLGSSREAEDVFGAALSAPIVEELGKGIALVAVFVVSRWLARRIGTAALDGVNHGIVYGAAIGIGFAFTENIFYFLQTLQAGSDLHDALGVFSARMGFMGTSSLGHAVYTGTFGAALGLAMWTARRWLRAVLPLAGLVLAMVMHASFNGLEQIILVARFGLTRVNDYYAAGGPAACPTGLDEICSSRAYLVPAILDTAFLVLFFLGILGWLAYQRRVIGEELIESAEAGLLGQKEAEIVPRYWRRSRWYWHVLTRAGVEKYRILRSVHALLVDLALTKRRLRRTGRTDRWNPRIERLWNRIAALRKAASAP